MKPTPFFVFGAIVAGLMSQSPAQAEKLAMINYETAPEKRLKALKLSAGQRGRREGIAIMDVDPESPTLGKILMDIPLPGDLIAHHIFYNKDLSKAYVTALGQSAMHVIDMKRFPYRTARVDTPGCKVQEDVVFSDDNKTWYLTCMGTANVIIGNAVTDKPIKTVTFPKPFYPHGIAIHEGIVRMLVTSTISPSLKDPGEVIAVVELSTGKLLSTLKLSTKPSPSGSAPVEILWVPGINPPTAYVTNMFGGSLWAAAWNPSKKEFDVKEVFDFTKTKSGVPLEIYFNKKADRMFLTTANPGHLHIFDMAGGPANPKLLKSVPAAEGAHHVALFPDEKYAVVQNNLLNLPGMDNGLITVIDLQKHTVAANIDTLKKRGFNANSIVALPEWYHPAGH